MLFSGNTITRMLKGQVCRVQCNTNVSVETFWYFELRNNSTFSVSRNEFA